MSKASLLILFILIIGVLYRLFLTANGNFIFTMDNGRDMVDVREMVTLGKLRLIGPTSAIDGFYNGPGWYYLLAIPFLLSGGDPYGAIVMEICFWAIGGFFLLKLVENFGKFAMIVVGSLWIASNFVILTTVYAFNPNPVLLLTPVFIFVLKRYLETGKLLFSLISFSIGGLFFNLEMNFGIFIPLIILLTLILSGKMNYLKLRNFWLGVFTFILFLAPQVLFDLRHGFTMTQAVLDYLSSGTQKQVVNPFSRVSIMAGSFFDAVLLTFMNNKVLTSIVLTGFFVILIKYLKDKRWREDTTFLVTIIYILIPFLGYIVIPTTVYSWHLGGIGAAFILFSGFLIKEISSFKVFSKLLTLTIAVCIIILSLFNMNDYFHHGLDKNIDPSIYSNEIAAIDYVYQKAEGKNFKVYIYLPSVYDYPYQYLIWWYGKKQYGYIPGEYVYLPNKPKYIPSKNSFEGEKDNFSQLIFLIKEPDVIKMRQAWENEFKDLEFVSKEMIGPIEVEIRKDISQS